MKTEIVSKVHKLGKAGGIIARITSVMLWIALVMCVLFLIAAMILPKDVLVVSISNTAHIQVDVSRIGFLGDIDDIIEYDDSELEIEDTEYMIESLEQTDTTLTATAQSGNYSFTLRSLIGVMISAIITLIAMIAALHYIEVLCKRFQECETPFAGEIVSAMRNVAFSLIPMAVLSQIEDVTLAEIAQGEADIVLEVNVMMIIVILFIFLLSAVFRYGAMLQQESDETL